MISTAILVAAATARLTRLVAQDEVTRPLRDRVDLLASGRPEGHPLERLSYLINCTKCVSIWAGGFCLALSRTHTGRQVLGVLAASEASIAVLSVQELISENEE